MDTNVIAAELAEEAMCQVAQTAETALAQLEAVLGSMTDALVIADAEGRILKFNAAALQLHGYRSIEEVHRHLHEFPQTFEVLDLEGVGLPVEQWPLAMALRGEAFSSLGRRIHRKDTNTDRVGSYSGTAVRDASGKVILAIMTIRDITQQQQAQEALCQSEAELRAFFDLASVGLAEADPATGRFLRVNEKFCQITGYPQAQLLEMTYKDITHPEDVAADSDKFKAMLADPAVSYCNAKRYLRKDGGVIWVEVNATAMRDEHGRALRTAAVIKDVTARHQVEEALRESEQKYHSLFDRNPDAVFALNVAGQITLANPACETVSGYRLAELLGRRFVELCAPDRREATIHKFQQTMAGGAPENLHTALIRKDGRRMELLITGGPVVVDGKVVAIHCAAKDITEIQRVEDALRRAKEQAEAASRAKDQFLAVLSHELRTPLTPVLPMVEMMEADQRLTARDREALAMIHRNVKLEVRLIDDLLDLNRISRGKLTLHRVPVDLHDLLQRVVQMCETERQSKRLEVKLQWNATQHHIRGDSARLQQILWNLLRNAVKFTPVDGKISLRTENRAKERVALIVTDSGMGISPILLPHIFNAFAQGEDARQFGGLGLGLAISKQLAELHGGTLTAQSEGEGRGATFTLELGTCAAGHKAVADPTLFEIRPPEKGGRILLVEDHGDTARTMERLLTSFGYEVRVADSVALALQLAATEAFDLLISDIGLPDGTGHALMRQLRSRRPIKGIVLSGYGMEEDIRKSKDAGFFAHLTKPVDVAVLKAALAKIGR